MSRESADEFRAGRLWDGYDYDRQAWVRNGRYVNCGHPKSMDCGCYGRLHMGERTTRAVDDDGHTEETVALCAACGHARARHWQEGYGGFHCHESGTRWDEATKTYVRGCSCEAFRPPVADDGHTKENASALDRAIAYLGAVQVADPDPAHTSPLYAYRDPAGSGRYAVMNADYLLLAHDTDNPLVLMPHWWTPERRFAAYKRPGEVIGTYRSAVTAYRTGGRVVTASLETGEEVPV